jgi:carbonic anhydrase
VIVCGHDSCGGVKATLDGIDGVKHLPSLHEWLVGVKPAADSARKLAPTADKDELLRVAVEENVLESMSNLLTFPAVEAGLKNGTLAMHGWVFDLAEGAVRVYDATSEEFVLTQQLSA